MLCTTILNCSLQIYCRILFYLSTTFICQKSYFSFPLMLVKRAKVSHFLYSNGVFVSIVPGNGKYTELFIHLIIEVIFYFSSYPTHGILVNQRLFKVTSKGP